MYPVVGSNDTAPISMWCGTGIHSMECHLVLSFEEQYHCQKNFILEVFRNFSKRLRIFNQTFTRLLYVCIYTKLQHFIQLSLTVTHKHTCTHTHTHPFYCPFSGTTRVSRCQKRTLWQIYAILSVTIQWIFTFHNVSSMNITIWR